jgi:hypothetical protein
VTRRRPGARTYVRFDDNYDESPKIAALSDAAFRAHVSAICYSGRNLTDGRIPAQVARKFGPPRAIRELVAAGLLIQTENGYEVHDYLEHQRSAEQVKDLISKRQEAGSRGGTAKAKGAANGVASATPDAKQPASKNVPEDKGQSTEVTPPPPPDGGEETDDPPRPSLQLLPQPTPSVRQDSGFAAFYEAYPRKVGRGAAARSWTRAIKKTPPEEIMEGLRRAQFSPDPQFIPHPSTWLNQERWADQPAAVPAMSSTGRGPGIKPWM